jgi:hypothetical protein
MSSNNNGNSIINTLVFIAPLIAAVGGLLVGLYGQNGLLGKDNSNVENTPVSNKESNIEEPPVNDQETSNPSPKGYCKSLFSGQRIEAKYNRKDLAHLEFGEVKNLNTREIGENTLVTGIVYLLDHPYPGYNNLEQISVTSGQYTHKYPYPVKFQITYNKDDEWSLDWYDVPASKGVSGTRLEGEGKCENAKIAIGEMEYPDGHHSYNLIFERIQQ